MNRRDGSVWTRWDLHLHAPGTKLSDSYGGGGTENLERFVKALEDSEVHVFGITDYFSFDGYLAVSEVYARLFPESTKLLIPNLEFRLTQTVSVAGKNVNAHVLIDPDVATKEKLQAILSDLKTHITNGDVAKSCSELSGKGDFERATVSIADIKRVLKDRFSDASTYMILMAANNDGLRGVDSKSPRSLSISDELDKASDAFFGVAKNTDHYLKIDRYEDRTLSPMKPVFTGSDAHSFEDLARLSGDEVDYDSTWIKADHSFRGLRQTLFEPKGRVHIGERPSVLKRLEQDATRFISELSVDQVPEYQGQNGSWFERVVIPFNPELTAIIGNKGSGKSAIADIIGLLGESRQQKHFSFLTDKPNNRKFRQRGYAENFSAKLTWASGSGEEKRLDEDVNELKPESVKYLPQNYFESLTNEIEVKAFRREIEEVVFSHVDETDRMGKSSFAELEALRTAQSKTEITELKAQLRQVNIEIVDLEQQADPSTKKSLLEQLTQKKEEYQSLEKSKPTEEPKPDQETGEQRAVSDEIDRLRVLRDGIELREKNAVTLLSSYKNDLMRLGVLKDAVTGIDAYVKEGKEELRSECVYFEIDADAVISHQVSTEMIDQKAEITTTEIAMLETASIEEITDKTDFDVLKSVPDLRSAHGFISDQIKVLQETLSAPHRRYQRYLQDKAEIETKMADVLGDEDQPKSGTIRNIEQRIHYIDNDLNTERSSLYKKRNEICRAIFVAKEKVRSFYESLKSSVEERLRVVSVDEFKVTIDASFVQSTDFSGRFFDLINQTARGPFRGSLDGRTALNALLAEVDWNSVDSVISFADKIIDHIKVEDVSKQVKDIKELYDFLFSFEYFNAKYELRLGGKNLNQLSPGEKGLLLLVFYLHLDKEKTPLIIDQPEDNLDNESIFSVLAKCIRESKKSRQVILVTHNPNLAVGADAEQIIYVTLDKAADYKFTYDSGAIENPSINDAIVKILEGSRPAFVQRRLKYQII
ncbi:AAA family ATPase [Thalassospiraceae bacterium SW-3-3]|nr:AAA family ATPase [Thalassospiraceae bacterium SW-3-3]